MMLKHWKTDQAVFQKFERSFFDQVAVDAESKLTLQKQSVLWWQSLYIPLSA